VLKQHICYGCIRLEGHDHVNQFTPGHMDSCAGGLHVYMKDFLAQNYYHTEHYGHVVKIMYTMFVYV